MGSQLCSNHFSVEWGGTNIGFMEVSGLGITVDVVAYRQGDAINDAATLMPGQQRCTPVVLKRVMVKGDNDFYNWINTSRFNLTERRDVIIKLLDDQQVPIVKWVLISAFPSRLDYAPLNSQDSNLASESLTLVYERLRVENP